MRSAKSSRPRATLLRLPHTNLVPASLHKSRPSVLPSTWSHKASPTSLPDYSTPQPPAISALAQDPSLVFCTPKNLITRRSPPQTPETDVYDGDRAASAVR